MPLRYPAERIVIKCPSWVGDLVAATGALRCLRRNYDAAHMALLIKPSLIPVLADAPWFDELVPWDRHESSRSDRRATRRTLRQGAYDLAVLLTHSLSSRHLVWSAGIPRRVGLVQSRRVLLVTDRVDISAVRGQRPFVSKVELYRALCEQLGCEGAEDQQPELFVSDALRDRAARLLTEAGATPGRPLLGIVPGAGYGPSKCWPPERFAALADRLVRQRGFDAVILTAPAEEPIAEAVASAMSGRPIRLHAGSVDLGLLKAWIEGCALVVCNDTGPRHYAIAFGVPVVTLMGPTDPQVTASPYEHGVVVRQPVPCAPCYRRRCPPARGHACMTGITVERVLDAAQRLLDSGGNGTISTPRQA